jgi:4'-phosphopantetheinyl transferase
MHDDWQPTGVLSPLDAESLQLWRIDLDDFPGLMDDYLKNLSPEELVRASRIRAGHVKAQFVIARACLRLLIGVNLSLDPRDVPIELGRYGKPETPPLNGRSLFFNLAHSRSTIVIALSRTGSIGVDLEYIDRKTDMMEVAANLFSPEEHAQFATIMEEHQRRLAFFRCWTRKEAVAKADGRGLSLPFTSFQVPILDTARAAPVCIEDGSAATYFISDLLQGETAVGAFAVASTPSRTEMFHFPR